MKKSVWLMCLLAGAVLMSGCAGKYSDVKKLNAEFVDIMKSYVADLEKADNAKEIRVLAEDLYGRLATFVGHMNRVGRQLASSVDHYNKAVGSLERNVLPGARKFVELGVHEKKAIEKLESLDPVPRTMIESSSDEDDAADLADAANDKTLQ